MNWRAPASIKTAHWVILIGLGFSAAVFIGAQIIYTNAIWNSYTLLYGAAYNQVRVATRQPAIKVKGLYLTAYSAGSSAKISEIISLLNKTELNSVVIDLKDYSGYILYDSDLPFVNKLGLEDVRIKDVPKLLEQLKSHKIYTIARISAFQDPLLAEKKPEWAIKSKAGGLWRDKKGLAWVDPTRPEVWRYVASVAREAARLGFDEINFDYIRFPTDGRLADIIYTNGGQKRREVIADFFSQTSKTLSDLPVYLSADLFGLTTEKSGEDDMFIGQRLSDAVKYFDYVCPMVYPSHYPAGYLGYANPADHPYEVVYNAISSGVKKAQGQRAKIRAWLQDFNLGAVYDGAKIRAQIDATDKAGADGWILWNAANRYTDAGLLAQ